MTTGSPDDMTLRYMQAARRGQSHHPGNGTDDETENATGDGEPGNLIDTTCYWKNCNATFVHQHELIKVLKAPTYA
jgi:hypothetical protein